MKRHIALITLSSDHQNGLAVANKLKYSYKPTSSEIPPPSPEQLKELLLKFFREHLGQHFKTEEKILAPNFPENEMMQRMLNEHVILNKMISEIESIPAGKDTLNDFGKMLEAHIRFEERELFPMIEKNLSEEQLSEIEKQIANNK